MAVLATPPKEDDWITVAARHAVAEMFSKHAHQALKDNAVRVIEKHMRAAAALARKAGE